MIYEILAYTTAEGSIETMRQVPKMGMAILPCFITGLVLLVWLIKWGLIIWGIVWLVKYLKRTKEEKQLFRLELGKLADEVQRLRKESKSDTPDAGPGNSD